MSEVEFFDTNILVFAFNADCKAKHEESLKLVLEVFRGERKGAVSNQVLSEFHSVLRSKIQHPLSAEAAANIVESFIASTNWRKLNYTCQTVLAAAEAFGGKGAIWDALIAQTMIENGLSVIVTDNLKDFSKLPGIKPLSPFATSG
jgi:predicted nucleic acid-binding protein